MSSPTKKGQSRAPLSLQEAIRQSTSQWQNNLDSLFQHAKERFPDVAWELTPPDDDMDIDEPPKRDSELVWGHKAIVYARAPPSFQNRYFAFRLNGNSGIRSPSPFHGSPEPTNYLDVSVSNVSLSLKNLDDFPNSRSPSPSHRSRPQSRGSLAPSVITVSNTGGILKLRTSINHALFSNELEYLYTGQGFGEAFEFLFDTAPSLGSTTSLNGDGTRQVVSTPRTSLNLDSEATSTQARIDKLRKDFVYMWRSRLYSDVRIALTGEFSSVNHETSTAVFSSHRFILASRCEYFKTVLMDWPSSKMNSLAKSSEAGEPMTLTLPSPPFTPASLHFSLGYIYTGTLVFSHRTYDLSTALSLLRSAEYLSLDALYDEVQARIVQEMMHGLGHAFLEWHAWENMGGGRFPTPGCRCRSCLRRAPRIFQTSVEPDVKNPYLERGARRVLVGAFGEGWCTAEFASLPPALRQSLLQGLRKRTTSNNAALPPGNGRGNVFIILWNAENALRKLQGLAASAAKKARKQQQKGQDGEEDDGSWIEAVREMIILGRRGAEEVLASESVECFSFPPPTSSSLSSSPPSHIFSTANTAHSSHPTASSHHEQGDWEQLIYSDGNGFDDSDRLTWIFDALKRGLDESNAAIVYQTLVERVLLLPHPDHPDKPFLGNKSKIRNVVEACRMDVLRWIRKKWVNMVPLGAFESLEDWSLKEISDHIEVPVEDLLLQPEANVSGHHSRLPTSGSKGRSAALRDHDSEVSSIHASVLPTPSITSSVKSGVITARRREKAAAVANSSSSIATLDRPDSKFTPESESTGRRTPTSSHTRSGAISPASSSLHQSGRRTPTYVRSGAPSPSLSSYSTKIRTGAISPSTRKVSDGSQASVASRSHSPSGVASRRGSVASTSSTATASTIRKSSAGSQSQASLRSSGTGLGRGSRPSTLLSSGASSSSISSLRQHPTIGSPLRSTSDASLLTASTSSVGSSSAQSEYRTATDGGGGAPSLTAERSRKGSGTSMASTRSSLAPSIRQSKASEDSGHHLRLPTVGTRPRQTSIASVTSSLSVASTTPTSKRPSSVASSIRSTTSTHSNSPAANARKAAKAATTAARTKQAEWKAALEKEKEKGKGPEKKVEEAQPLPSGSGMTPTISSITIRPTTKAAPTTPSSTSTLRRKGSSDTITGSRRPNARAAPGGKVPPLPSAGVSPRKNVTKSTFVPLAKTKERVKGKENLDGASVASKEVEKDKDGIPLSSTGATLEIGIPCIISSKRKRFKAYARFIGEVEGETGSWVGVEVPMDDSWTEDEIMADSGENLLASVGSLDGRETPAVVEGPQARQWNDGTWGGIRYFEIGPAGSEWDYDDRDRGRGSRRRRLDWSDSGMSTFGRHGLKRQGDSSLGMGRIAKRMRSSSPSLLSDSGIESRGLFVRPGQVLYVVDA